VTRPARQLSITLPRLPAANFHAGTPPALPEVPANVDTRPGQSQP
jgi:hypothetical protein